jgi:hypothetical protein
VTPRHAALLACLWPLLAWAQPVLGTPPRHAPPTLAEVPNAQAITQRIWAPGIDDGYVPQGVAWAGGRLYLSAYRSTDPAVGQGPCRVFQIDPAHGTTLGWLDMPPGCGHAGGLVALDERTLVLGDTRRLYRIDLIAAFGPQADATRAITATVGLRGALKASSIALRWSAAAAGHTCRPAHTGTGALAALGGAGHPQRQRHRRVRRHRPHWPSDQGAGHAFDRTGALWLSTSDSRHGLLARSDSPGQAPTARHAMVIGMEGLAFDAQGALWSVSEAGSLRWQRWGVHFPVLFRIDPARLQD